MSNKTALAVVVYNQWCGNSVTCKTINAGTLQPDAILVVDNSTREMNNREYCQQQGWMYHSMGGNAGLSKAYNAAISVLRSKVDLIIWADDDTVFPSNYMEKTVGYALKFPKKELFLPIVKSRTTILSPALYTQRRILAVKELSELNNMPITAINSGMAVRMSLYDNYCYDEAIFLDYLDHDFMRWCRVNGKHIRIMEDVQLFQNFFAEGNPSYAARKHRMKIFCRDIRVFEAKCGKSKLLTEWDLLHYCYNQYKMFLRTVLQDMIKSINNNKKSGG